MQHANIKLISAWFYGFLAISSTVNPAWAQLANWNNPNVGATAGIWSTAANWSPAIVPGSNSTAVIGNAGEAKLNSNVSASRIEVGKNGGIGVLSSSSAGITISTDSDFDIGEVGGTVAANGVTVSGNGTVNLSNVASILIGTGGDGDLDIGQSSTTLNGTGHGNGNVTLQNIALVDITTNVELAKAGGSAIATANGSLSASGIANFMVGNDFDVGQVSGSQHATGVGTATMTNISNFSVGMGIDVGRTSGSPSGINAGQGTLTITNSNVSAGFTDSLNPGSLNVGGASVLSSERAQASGLMTVQQSTLAVASSIHVADLTGGGTNPATTSTGTLNLIDSHATAKRLSIATVAPGTLGAVQGKVHLESSLVGLTESLTLGNNAILEVGLSGTSQANGTGAAKSIQRHSGR